ncbi:MAG TPA: hypothetical protein VHE99_06140 [Gammaproteobacteria bacterium]|nr:hypothetical protein [Gammaproteobacteria bacterium]
MGLLGVYDLKQQSDNFRAGKQKTPIDNPHFFIAKNPQLQDEILGKTESKLKSDRVGLLEGGLSQLAMDYARRFRKNGYTEPDNNDRSPKEFKNLHDFLNTLLENNEQTIQDTLDWLNKHHGRVTSQKALEYGAEMHTDIVATKSTFLANCDQMGLLVLDFLEQLGYKGAAALVEIIEDQEEQESTTDKAVQGHTFVVVNTDAGQQIWDPWTNKAYFLNEQNAMDHLKIWKWGTKSNGTANHQLEPYHPEKHELSPIPFRTLENLRSFREAMALARENELGQTQADSKIIASTIQPSDTEPKIADNKETAASLSQQTQPVSDIPIPDEAKISLSARDTLSVQVLSQKGSPAMFGLKGTTENPTKTVYTPPTPQNGIHCNMRFS